MIHFTHDEKQMLSHIAEVVGDRLDDTYKPEDEVTVDKVDQMGKTETGCLVVTGEPLDQEAAASMVQQVITAELNHWVPGASQRLIYRAGKALDIRTPVPAKDTPDCGNEPGWHALINDWVVGIYVMRCVTCARLYRA